MANFCINIDWFEVFTYEPEDCYGPQWYEQLGYKVADRGYGTRVFNEMFTLIVDGHPWLEVRRDPCSKKRHGGILPDKACTLRLVNRALYDWFPINDLFNFMRDLGFKYKTNRLCCVSRVDLAIDFIDKSFEIDGTPVTCNDFIKRYMSGEWWKIGASKVEAYGEEFADGMHYHALKFGSPTSMVGTKLYNKTLEMAQIKMKPYIIENWINAGLLTDDQDTAEVWRLEFSIHGNADGWVEEKTPVQDNYYQSNDIEAYVHTENYITFLKGLISHYFCFAKKEPGKSKYRCTRFSPLAVPASTGYRPIHLANNKLNSGRGEKVVINKLAKMRDSGLVDERYTNLIDAVIYLFGILYGQRRIGQSPDTDIKVFTDYCEEVTRQNITQAFEYIIGNDRDYSQEDRYCVERAYALYRRKIEDFAVETWRKQPYSISAVEFAKREHMSPEEMIERRHLLEWYDRMVELNHAEKR